MNALPKWSAMAVALALTAGAASAETVKVHSSWPKERLAELERAAAAVIPGLKLEFTGEDKAEMLWGVPVYDLMELEREAALEPYSPRDANQLRPSFRSASAPMGWVGLTASAPALCYNTIIGTQTFAMPTPSTWEIVAGPNFRLGYGIGPQVQIVDPAQPGTGGELLTGWTAAMGETAAARFITALKPNISGVVDDAAEVCRAVARGHAAIGVGVTRAALDLAAEGAPLQIIVPTPVAYDMQGAALRKGASAAAKALADFAVSPEAMAIYARDALIVSRPGVQGTIDPVPAASSRDLETIEFEDIGEEARRLLADWRAAAKPSP